MVFLTGTEDDQVNTENDVRAMQPVSFVLLVLVAAQIEKLGMPSSLRRACTLNKRPRSCGVIGMAQVIFNASRGAHGRQRIDAASPATPHLDLGRSSDVERRVYSSELDAYCAAVRFGRAVGVRAFVGMKPSEQVYSQVVEREQFRDTTKDNEGGDGEIHHATAIC